MELRKRKPTRLKDYDYSSNGRYFITICTQKKECVLGDIVGDDVLGVPKIKLSDMGIIVKEQIEEMEKAYSYLHVAEYVIMPNHVHFIITVNAGGGTPRTSSPTGAIIPQYISTLKRFTNKKIGFSIWQRTYHDHIIRSKEEYIKIQKYIQQNPKNWESDFYNTPENFFTDKVKNKKDFLQ